MNPISRTLGWLGDVCKRAAGGDLAWDLRRSLFGWGMGVNTTGVKVDERAMLSLAVGRRCVDAVATDLAAMPLQLVQVMDDDEERPAKEHSAYSLFRYSPDGGATTPMRWRQALVGNTLSWGNGLAEVERSPDGENYRLYILSPMTCSPHVDPDGRLVYLAGQRRVDPSDVIHVAGLGFDGVRGYPPVKLHPQAFGLAIAAERFGGAFLGNGAFPGGFIESPFEMGEEEFVKFRDAFVKQHAKGVEKAGRVGVLPPGFKFSKAAIDPQAAQLMELRLFQVLEVCRIFGVPPHRVMQYENMHYSTVEAVKAEFAQTTLLPWARAVEESLNLRLLTRDEVLAGYTFRHDFTAYMRADSTARAAMYRVMYDTKSISPNEIRVQEGYPARKDPGGKVFGDQLGAAAVKAAAADLAKEQQS